MYSPADWQSGNQDQQQGVLRRKTSNPAFVLRLTRSNAAQAGLAVPSHPGAGRPVVPQAMDPAAPPPALPFPYPPTPNQPSEDTGQDQALHAEPAPPVFDREALRAVCDEILNCRLALLHRNRQAIPALNGIIEDVFARLGRIERSDWSDRADQQQKQQLILALNNIRNHVDAVAADRTTAREQLEHHDQAPACEEDFTDDEQDDAVQVRLRTETNRPAVSQRRGETPLYYSEHRSNPTRNTNNHHRLQDDD